MADPGFLKRRATYQDVLDAPDDKVAEIIDGELFLSPRPARRHTIATSNLFGALGPTLGGAGRGGSGGWRILFEPELHFADEIVVPDLAGWRRDRDLEEPNEAFFIVPPDWICEVLSPSTEKLDRTRKLRIYAGAGVQHAWLVHPIWCSLEVLRFDRGNWTTIAVHAGDSLVRAEPFDAIELDLSALWRDLPPPPSRASDVASEYSL